MRRAIGWALGAAAASVYLVLQPYGDLGWIGALAVLLGVGWCLEVWENRELRAENRSLVGSVSTWKRVSQMQRQTETWRASDYLEPVTLHVDRVESAEGVDLPSQRWYSTTEIHRDATGKHRRPR